MNEKQRILRINLKGKYWHQINNGEKLTEYRLANNYWEKRLRPGLPYDEVHLLLGYPKKGDESKLIKRKWVNYPMQEQITHDEFGPDPVMVYAIDVSQSI